MKSEFLYITYLVTITLINNRKIHMRLLVLIFTKIAKSYTHEMFYNHRIVKVNTGKNREKKLNALCL